MTGFISGTFTSILCGFSFISFLVVKTFIILSDAILLDLSIVYLNRSNCLL